MQVGAREPAIQGSSRIRRARERSGTSLRELARRLGVTVGAVQHWEESESRDAAQIGTVKRALEAMGEQLFVVVRVVGPWSPLDRREERVTLELHRAVAHKLIDDPEAVLGLAPRNLEGTRAVVAGSAHRLLDEWADLIAAGDIPSLLAVMLGTDSHSIAMRQVGPFQGVLGHAERIEAISRAA